MPVAHNVARRFLATQPRVAAMSETEFWRLIEPYGWGTKTTNSDAIEKNLMGIITPDEADALQETFSKLKGELSRAITRYEKQNDVSVGLGDDGFGDLLAHIVGMGRKEYEATLRDPQLAIDRAKANKFKESFAYALPSKRDYENLNVGKYVTWAKKQADDLSETLRGANDLRNQAKALEDTIPKILEALEPMAKGDYKAFLALEGQTKPLLQKLEKEGGTSPWGVLNLFSDVKKYLP